MPTMFFSAPFTSSFHCFRNQKPCTSNLHLCHFNLRRISLFTSLYGNLQHGKVTRTVIQKQRKFKENGMEHKHLSKGPRMTWLLRNQSFLWNYCTFKPQMDLEGHNTIFIKTKPTKTYGTIFKIKGKLNEKWFEIVITLQLTREPVVFMIALSKILVIRNNFISSHPSSNYFK